MGKNQFLRIVIIAIISSTIASTFESISKMVRQKNKNSNDNKL